MPCTRHWCHLIALLPGRGALRCVPPALQPCRTQQQYLISQEMSTAAVPACHQELSPRDTEVQHQALELGTGTGEHPCGMSPGLHRELPPPPPQQQGASTAMPAGAAEH